jgi:beta-N-acetylglucosaminidase
LPLITASNDSAEVVANASVIASVANVRSTPQSDITTNIIGTVSRGQRLAAGSAIPSIGTDSYQWCAVTYEAGGTQISGYVVFAYISLDDPEFTATLKSLGFPDSYIPYLTKLHGIHPNWSFQAIQTGLDWNTVVAGEASIGTSLIYSSVDDAWKSTDPGTYDWYSNTYTPYDGTSWVNASKDIVAYYLDPRNFLTDPGVFQFLSLSYDGATQSESAVQKQLATSFMASGTVTSDAGAAVSYSAVFMDAGQQSGASPYFLVSRVLQEVSPSGSRSTSGTEPAHEGYYNYYNIGASSSPDPVILGLLFAQYGSSNPTKYPMSPENQAKYLIPWNSPYRSIVGGAKFISQNYISRGQNTLYFQKFDVISNDDGLYKHQYMTNIQAMTGESTTLYSAYSKFGILDVPLTFCIPVYSGMTDSVTPLPAKTGNPNNFLSQIAVDGFSITPSFDPGVTDGYSLIVPFQASQINLSAAAVSSFASVAGIGSIPINVGENKLPITVTAQNGAVRIYNLTVVRSESTGEDAFTTSYTINGNGTISKVVPGTNVSTFSSGITLLNGGKLEFLNATGSVISASDHMLVSGDRVRILDASSNPVYDYPIVIYGDANGDGKITSSDLTVICRHVLKKTTLTGIAAVAADVNRDGKISSSDLTLVCRHVLKKTTLEQ